MNFQIICYTIGLLLTIFGALEMIPALLEWSDGHDNAKVFFFNSLVCMFFGGALVIANRNHEKRMKLKEAFLLTTLSWTLLSMFAALPLYMADLNINFADAFFEAMSGLTTTGSTILSGLDDMSRGVLLWRSILQWIGGIGIIGFAIILLPFLKVGGMQLFQTESSDKSEKIMPRSNKIVSSLFYVYMLITLACIFTYRALGMSWFDAINHAFTTICTGGYSTHDASFGFYDSPALQYAGTIFMLCGGIPFILFVKAVYKMEFVFWKDDQFRALIWIVVGLSLLLTLWLYQHSDYSLETSFRYSIFSIVSVMTTTGYAVIDYTTWGWFAVIFFFFLTYVGAGAGSTAGGAKIMRLVIAGKVVGRHLKMLLYPNGNFPLRYQGKNIDNTLVLSVLGFLSLYVISNAILTIALALTGVDFYTAVSGAATAIANVGPGIGSVIGPAGNFSTLPDSALWLLSAGMLLGRLEILTVIVLFTPGFWRK